MAKNWIIESTVETDEIVLNDSGSPVNFRIEGDTDENLFVVNAKTDKVGIGTDSPEGQFDVISASTDEEFHVINAYRFGNIRWAGHMTVRKARGTFDSPLAVSWDGTTDASGTEGDKDNIGVFFTEAWDGSKYVKTGGFSTVVDGQYSSGTVGVNKIPSRLLFWINDGTVETSKPGFIMTPDFRVAIGNFSDDGGVGGLWKKPSATLEVLGTLSLLKGNGVTTDGDTDNGVAVDEILTTDTAVASGSWADDQLASAALVHELFATTNSSTNTTVEGKVLHKIVGRVTDDSGTGTINAIPMWSYDGGEVHIGDTVPPASHQYQFGVKGTVGINNHLYVGGNTTAGEFGDASTHKDVNVTFKSDTADKDFLWDGGNNSLTLGTSGGATKGVDFTVYGDKDGSVAADQRYMFWDANGNTDGNLTIAAANIMLAHTSNSHITPFGAAPSGFTHKNDVPLIVQAHVGNTTAPITDFRNASGATMAEIKSDGSISAQGALAMKRAKYLNLQYDIAATPSSTAGSWISNNSGTSVQFGGGDFTFVDTTAGKTVMTIDAMVGAGTGAVTITNSALLKVGLAASNTAIAVETDSTIADGRFTEDTNNYRGIYTSNFKIDNNANVIEAIGSGSNVAATFRGKGTGKVTIGTAGSGETVLIGHGTSETTIGDNLTVAGNLTVTGSTSITVTGLDQYGTDQAYFEINKDSASDRIRLTSDSGTTLKVLRADQSSAGILYTGEVYNNNTLTIQTTGSNGDINLIPNGSGNVYVGSTTNSSNLTVYGNVVWKTAPSFPGQVLTDKLDTTGQATDHHIVASTAGAWEIKEANASGTNYLQANTNDNTLKIFKDSAESASEVTMFEGSYNDHDVLIYGRGAGEYLTVTSDDDLHSRNQQAAVSIVGMPLYLGYDTSNHINATLYGASGELNWVSASSSFVLGDSTPTNNADGVNFDLYGYKSVDYLKWTAYSGAAVLSLSASGGIDIDDTNANIDNGKVTWTTSTSKLEFTGGSQVSFDGAYVSLANATNLAASSDTVALGSTNVLRVDTSSGSVAIGGIVRPADAMVPLWILKTSSSNTLTLEHSETGTAANNIYTSDQQDMVLNGYAGAMLMYNKDLDRWQVISGTAEYDATAEEVDRACDVSARLIASSASDAVTLTEHENRIIYMTGTGGAKTYTLPAATATGSIYKFIVGAVNTSNHLIKVADSSTVMDGTISICDNDDNSVKMFFAASDGDTITLNGTTTGGAVGDYIELIDVASNQWVVRGWCQCPAGSNPATPFSATVS